MIFYFRLKMICCVYSLAAPTIHSSVGALKEPERYGREFVKHIFYVKIHYFGPEFFRYDAKTEVIISKLVCFDKRLTKKKK